MTAAGFTWFYLSIFSVSDECANMANTEALYINVGGDLATKDCILDLNAMKMNNQVLPLSPFLRQKGQVFLQQAGCVSNRFEDLKTDDNEHLPRLSNFSTHTGSTRTFKTDYNRRARNVISSRKYRKKRKTQYLELEHDNRLLQESINEAERVQTQLNQAFHMLIQHAELCDKCCDIKLCFE